MLDFSIVTPSFRSSRWLKLCLPSVADQDVSHEHIVQDSCSDDGTGDWLPFDPRIKAFIEKDRGMYDAVNRGLLKSSGRFLCYINCDEQYLPGALKKVIAFFDRNPGVDVVFANTIVVNQDGNYLCHRKSTLPRKYHASVSGNLSILTCSTFFRRRLIDDFKLFFNPDLKDVGDGEWVIRLLEARVRMAVLPEFTSVFTETGQNMNLLPNALREKKEMLEQLPWWVKKLKWAFILRARMDRLMSGGYFQEPFEYAIYNFENPTQRKLFQVEKPTSRWRRLPLNP